MTDGAILSDVPSTGSKTEHCEKGVKEYPVAVPELMDLDISLLELVGTWDESTNLDAALELQQAQTELELEAAAQVCATSALELEASALACGRVAFVEAMRACGLLDELLAGSVGLTLLVPPDEALTALPESTRRDDAAMRALLHAHVCLGVHTSASLQAGGGERALLHTLGGQAHSVRFEADGARVANARVERADVGFNHGVVQLLDALLWSLAPVGEIRPEQVRSKKVLPPPEVEQPVAQKRAP